MIPVPVEATMNSFKSSWCSTSMAFVPRTVDGQVPTSERHSSTILRRRLAGSHPKVGSFNNRRGVVSSSSSSSTSLSLLGSDDVDLISATNIPCLYNHKIRHHHQHQHKFQQKHTKHTTLFDSYRPYDNLFSGLAEISLGCSIGVLWSEISIALTGCGPSNLSDTLKGSVICLFNRVVSTATSFLISGGESSSSSSSDSSGLSSSIVNEFLSASNSLGSLAEEQYGPLQSLTTIQIQAAEFLSVLAVFGSVLVLGLQYYVRGTTMDGLSGIDIDLCRAIQDL
eukprot:CAMPEP_0113454672 /NCGR_PEP_ID=MMETSP0014_2-20120614/7983_1 /TAXON_ID=2857 /ORGANISM="Nitzschia sp." /LENGTH=281 /DNA_ID=CAMNT_0000346083 /DNA_START=168 /DNA_END=1014 /DNA_ORIENTATION=- /assembly_acc=CAM_ASM_000159